jgi:hypothetical protein
MWPAYERPCAPREAQRGCRTPCALPLEPQPRILACFRTNQAGLSAREKVGFVGKGTLRQAVYIDCEYMDVVDDGNPSE